MKNILNYCFDLKRPEKVLEEPSMEYGKNNILNMDVSTSDGLAISFENQIVNSGMIDLVVSNYFLSASALFTNMHNGQTFTILRHPIDQALSLFYSRRKYNKAWMSMSFHDFVSQDGYMDGWMVRQLTGTMPWVELTETHLERAKSVMQRKIFVGIMTELDETMRQFRAHFGWQEKEEGCAHHYLHEEYQKDDHPGLQGGRGGKTWNVLVEKEKWDLSLYYFALELFAEQRERYLPQPKPEEAFDGGGGEEAAGQGAW